jgi:hypothetical protein
VCKNGPKGAHRGTRAKKSQNLPRPFGGQDDILGRVIIGDETWVCRYDPAMKQQSAQWKTANSPQAGKFHQSKPKSQNNFANFFLY